MKQLKISIGSDHAGFEYKKKIIKSLASEHKVNDEGCFSADSVDYPDYAHAVANAVSANNADIGILICGSGNGVAMTANKHEKVRAALCWKVELAKLARSHNDANVLCIPARFISINLAKKMVEAFIDEKFEGGRHAKRVNKISC